MAVPLCVVSTEDVDSLRRSIHSCCGGKKFKRGVPSSGGTNGCTTSCCWLVIHAFSSEKYRSITGFINSSILALSIASFKIACTRSEALNRRNCPLDRGDVNKSRVLVTSTLLDLCEGMGSFGPLALQCPHDINNCSR